MAPIVSEAVEPIVTGPSLKLPWCSIFGLPPHQMAHSAPDNRNAAFVLAPRWGARSRCGVEDSPGQLIDGGVFQRMGAHVRCSQLSFGRRHYLRRRAENLARTIPTLRDADGPVSAPAVRTSDWAYAHVGGAHWRA